MKILRINCSPRGARSESGRLANSIVENLTRQNRSTTVTVRELGAGGLPHVDDDYASTLGNMGVPEEGTRSTGSMPQSDRLIEELESAECVVIATPMHNFTVPSGLKAWIDHIVRVRRTFHPTPGGKVGTLHDRPVYVAISSGGRFSGESARQPDFLRPYLTAILATIGLRDVHFFAVEGTGMGPQAVAETRKKTADEVAAHFTVGRVTTAAVTSRL
jgi:FMN-dependent NADH-azoreductase